MPALKLQINNKSTTINFKFMAVDLAGNPEEIQNETYI